MPSRTSSRRSSLATRGRIAASRPARSCRWLLSCLALAAGAGQAAELRSLQVSNQGARYTLESEAFLDAPVPAVYRVLLDYENFTQLSSVYEQSRHLPPGPDGKPRVYTLAEGCILFVCRQVEKVETLHVEPNRRIVATVVPGLSNLEAGVTEWMLAPDGRGTRLRYRMELTPAFWVPPLIGPPVIRYVLAKGGEEALQRLEARAAGRAHGPRETPGD